ncbi:exopolyphosphatase [Amphibiibacter pelophylacis]|uniref:Ppx/GppA phosphatase family protein n=1 Tax=Amphibiibacter pelophylacis TaxID=1799477 RepID=A0ACC6P079_9BURK
MVQLLPPHQMPLVAVDMGSNSFRYEIGRIQDGQYERIAYEKESVRLGAGLDERGLLTGEAAQRGLDCLARFGAKIRKFRPERVRAVATQTLREARNRDDFLREGQKALGFPIEVIPGREEARLIYCGVSFLQPSESARLVIDIGGRSTEMVLGQGREQLAAESFQLGSVSLSMAYFGRGELTESAFEKAGVAAGAALQEALVPFDPSRWTEVLGSSGTAGAVAQFLATRGVSDGVITAEGLRWCIRQCVKAGHVDALPALGIKPDRAPVIAGGLSILQTLMTLFRIERIVPARGALRQGVIVDLHDRLQSQALYAARQKTREGATDAAPLPVLDVRDQTVTALQARYHVDLAQARRVGEQALALQLQVARLPHEEHRELGWAAALHEVGMTVSHHDHHRHTAYVLAHSDAPGFSQSQQRRLAQLTLGQRGRLRKISDDLAHPGFRIQCLCLRLAVILCNARLDAPDGSRPGVKLAQDGQNFSLKVAKKWALHHPQTLHLLRQESQEWDRLAGGWKLQIVD